jgi:hypothetical protein
MSPAAARTECKCDTRKRKWQQHPTRERANLFLSRLFRRRCQKQGSKAAFVSFAQSVMKTFHFAARFHNGCRDEFFK